MALILSLSEAWRNPISGTIHYSQYQSEWGDGGPKNGGLPPTMHSSDAAPATNLSSQLKQLAIEVGQELCACFGDVHHLFESEVVLSGNP